MSSNIEFQIIGKIVELQDFHTVEKLRIDETYFLGDQNSISQTREAFLFLKAHYHNEATFGSVPSWQLLQQRFYGFPYVFSTDTLPTLCQELRRWKLRSQILAFTDELTQTVEVDPAVALNTVREAASRLVSEHEISSDMLLSSAHEQLLQEYNLVQNGNGILGIPWPWDVLNEETQGMQEGNFIIFYGRPKSMKTWVALYVACWAYMKGMRVLVYSLEMSTKQVLRRCACIIAQVDYDKFKKGKLDPANMSRVFQILQNLRNQEESGTDSTGHQAALLVSRPSGNSGGISHVHAKIREFSPDLAVVDGLYLMKDDRAKARTIDWKSIAHISQDLKGTAQMFEIPVIGVTQANRGADKDPTKADLAELAYADALAQDCDLCMRVTSKKDPTTKETEIILTFPGARDSVLDGFVINGMPAVNFGFKRTQIVDPNAPPTQQGGGNSGSSGGGSRGGGQRTAAVIPTNWRGP